MEKRTKSKYEGNWTMGDCIQFFKDALGTDRYDMIRNLWILDNQQMIEAYNEPDNLREIWIHKITMQEVPQDKALKDITNHINIKVPV